MRECIRYFFGILILGMISCDEVDPILLTDRSVKLQNKTSNVIINVRATAVQSDIFYLYDSIDVDGSSEILTIEGDSLQLSFRTMQQDLMCLYDEKIRLRFERSTINIVNVGDCIFELEQIAE